MFVIVINFKSLKKEFRTKVSYVSQAKDMKYNTIHKHYIQTDMYVCM